MESLHNLNTEELGRLFPVILEKYNPAWGDYYEKECQQIMGLPGSEDFLRTEHIGSTGIPGIMSKASIDILLEITGSAKKDRIVGEFRSLGYQFIPSPENPPPHMMFVKGYTLDGFKGQAYHVHVRYRGDWDEIRFRDYLRQHPHLVLEYEKLKQKLEQKFRNDREAYTEGKTDFVNRINKLARET